MTEKSYSETRCENIKENLKVIRNNISEAAIRSGRNPDDIKLMAVTKTVEVEFINYAMDNCGIDLIGENKVQEFFSKKDKLHRCESHLIGHLQTNKVKQIVGEVSCIQSVDSVKVAKEISKYSLQKGIKTNILLEVNIGKEQDKFGIMPENFDEIFSEIATFDGILIKGLMAIPPISEKIEKSKQYFENMYKLFLDIQSKKGDNIDITVLSQGMSADYSAAIECGSNLVRVGSAIFGDRIY